MCWFSGEKKLMKNLGSSFQRLNISKVEQIISEKENLEEGNYVHL